MSLNASEIACVLEEMGKVWGLAHIQKVSMDGRHLVILSLRIPGQNGFLALSIAPNASYLCIKGERGRADPEPSSFCMLLRRVLGNQRILNISQINDDRIVAIQCRGGTLIVEMLGAHGCFVVTNSDGLVVTAVPHGHRPGIKAGQTYEPPPPPREKQSERNRLEVGKANEQVLSLFCEAVTHQEGDQRKAELGRRLHAQIAKRRRLVANIEGDVVRAAAYEELKRKGELLKLNLSRVRQGMQVLKVEDILFADGQLVEIALDPRLNATGNLEQIFERARKAKRGFEIARTRLDDAKKHLALLESLEERLHLASQPEDFDAIAAIIAEGRPSHLGGSSRKQGGQPRLPYHLFRDRRGKEILVGRSASENDLLTTEIARPSDLWLHARGRKGSHVVMRLDRNEEVDSQSLIDAATLAAHFSDARGEHAVEVTYTQRRYVRKGKGAPLGQVSLLREKVIMVVVEPKRLQRLLAHDVPESPPSR